MELSHFAWLAQSSSGNGKLDVARDLRFSRQSKDNMSLIKHRQITCAHYFQTTVVITLTWLYGVDSMCVCVCPEMSHLHLDGLR